MVQVIFVHLTPPACRKDVRTATLSASVIFFYTTSDFFFVLICIYSSELSHISKQSYPMHLKCVVHSCQQIIIWLVLAGCSVLIKKKFPGLQCLSLNLIRRDSAFINSYIGVALCGTCGGWSNCMVGANIE